MIEKTFLIAGGNSTLLVEGASNVEKDQIIKNNLGLVEQIGFITRNDKPSLTMMGNELCINATIAFASLLYDEGILLTSGTPNVVRYTNTREITSISLELPYKQENKTILFEGIGYIMLDEKPTKEFLMSKCIDYNLPAFGGIVNKGDEIAPFVYVHGTNSYMQETACGSGSIATSILTGLTKIFQPTKEPILVEQNNYLFTVKAKVVRIH